MQRLQLRYDESLSNFAFNFNVRHYNVVGALDPALLSAMQEVGTPVYDLPYGNLDGGSSHASGNWKTFAKLRISQVRCNLATPLFPISPTSLPSQPNLTSRSAQPHFPMDPTSLPYGPNLSCLYESASPLAQVRALLSMGFDVLMSDVDVVWTRDPRPFLQCGYDAKRAALAGAGAGAGAGGAGARAGVGRCRSTVSKPELKARLVLALETKM
jgi:hypothetical protein